MALARKGFSPGSADGKWGQQSQQALGAYQEAHGLPVTGNWDTPTQAHLKIEDPVFVQLQLTPWHFNQIDPPFASWRDRGARTRMAHHTLLEMIAEQAQSHPELIIALNPEIDWTFLQPGQQIKAPRIPAFRTQRRAEEIRIFLSERRLQANDKRGRLLFHAPVSIARHVDKRPTGQLKVTIRVENPNYTFNPAILSAAAARENIIEKFIIEPGPNNPVGTIWIGLSLPSYGIHGTPEPEKVGRTESNGCFRLANWNAEALLQMVDIGIPVHVYP